MADIINIYCDESCHLEHDSEKAMVLGGIWCPKSLVKNLHHRIAELKATYKLSPFFEIKWGKASTSKLDFYEALISLFFDTPELNFRAWVIPDKTILRHSDFQQTHDDWYYKMYFNMLKTIIHPNENREYHIYLDIKDTRSQDKLRKLHEVLSNVSCDFQQEMISNVQHVHSHDIGLLQLADLFIGAIAYSARELDKSKAKIHLLEIIKTRSGLTTLAKSTSLSASKINICFWQPYRRDVDVC